MKNLFKTIKENREKLFCRITVLYIYILYIRSICLSYESILMEIDNDYYHFVINKKQWLSNHYSVHFNIAIIIFLFTIILISLYLLYKKSHYFYVILLIPVFLGLASMSIATVYGIINSF